MKKIFSLVFVITLLLTGVAYAEMSATTYTGNKLIDTKEEQVFIMAYNNSGDDIPAGSHAVVVLDTSMNTTSGQASNAVGTFFTSTTTAGNPLVLGVTDGSAIKDKSVGRICVRGPIEVDMCSGGVIAYAAGATVTTSTTEYHADTVTNRLGFGGTYDNGMDDGILGVLLVKSNYDTEDVNTVDGVAYRVWYVWLSGGCN